MAGQITLTPVADFPALLCPVCNTALPDRLVHEDGDTVTPPRHRTKSRSVYIFLGWMTCPHCKNLISQPEIAIIPHSTRGYTFIDDNCWGDDDMKKFTARTSNLSWKCLHFSAVTAVTFINDSPFVPSMDLLSDNKKNHPHILQVNAPWLDKHRFKLFSADDIPDAFQRASALAKDILPELLKITW